MKRRLESLWARLGRIQVTDMAKHFFLVRFSDAEDYRRAAFKGPWKIYDYYISVARWSPSFNDEEPVKSILTWVRLPKLPIQYFNHVAVTRIGNAIGKTIRLDLATEEGARAKFASVCVEVDLSKPLLGKYLIEDRVMHIEYESLENICVSCGFYGHKVDSCPSQQPHETEQAKPSEPEREAGSWMIVERRQKKKSDMGAKSVSVLRDTGSRFSVLLNEEVGISKPNTTVPKAGPAQSAAASKIGGNDGGDDPASKVFLRALHEASLEKASNSKATDGPKHAPQKRSPLQDISNSHTPNDKPPAKGIGRKKDKGGDSSSLGMADELVSVPITYQNLVFQTNPPTKGQGSSISGEESHGACPWICS
ncbi:hypothetical protein LINPERHAP2_LOCUS11424 [Linum perenne]